MSPMLANIYMHHVLTLWFKLVVKKEMQGECFLINFADDFVAGFQYKSEAERYYKELKERMEKFGLELESSKSRLIEFGRFAEQNRRAKGEHKPETFDFLGFTFYCTLIFWMMTKGKMQSFLKKHFMRKKSGSTDACTAGK